MTLSTDPSARTRAGQRWRTLGERLQSVSPQALTRFLIATAVIGVSTALVAATWPSLAPFVVGAIAAYAVLPIANRLDRFMPRVVAAVLAELVAVAVLVGVALIVLPPLLEGVVRFALSLPSGPEIEARLADLQAQLGTLPEPIGGIVTVVATEVISNLQAVLNQAADGAAQFVTQQILGFFGTVTFVLGLLVIPAWILTVVADERSIKQRGVALLAPSIRGDVVAAFRIIDRAASTFLRVRVLLAIVSSLLIWIGLLVARQLGIGEYQYAIAAAVLLGSLQLIPELGFYLGFFPIALVLALAGPLPALGTLVAYILGVKAASAMVETRVSQGVLDVHPALLIPSIVVLSSFGPLWFFAAAPVVAILRDLVRYAGGRLGDPPAPANVLPGERVPASRAVAVAAVPAVYRGRTAGTRGAVAPRSAAPGASVAASTASSVPAVAAAAASGAAGGASAVPAFGGFAPRPSAAAVIERSSQP